MKSIKEPLNVYNTEEKKREKSGWSADKTWLINIKCGNGAVPDYWVWYVRVENKFLDFYFVCVCVAVLEKCDKNLDLHVIKWRKEEKKTKW